MYIGDLGKGKFKGRFKKLATTAVRAVAAYYTGGASEAFLAAQKAAKQRAQQQADMQQAQAEAAAAMMMPPAPVPAITQAAERYYASRPSAPGSSAPGSSSPGSFSPADDEAVEAPRSFASFGLGGMKIPPALLIAGLAVPLLFIVLRPAHGRR